MTFSVRGLLVCVIFAAFAIAALTTGGSIATMLHALVVVLALLIAITAVAGTKLPRAMACGFLVPAIAYGGLLYSSAHDEYDPHEGKLFSTTIGRYGYEALYRPWYTSEEGKKVSPNFVEVHGADHPESLPNARIVGEFPVRSTYMTSVHAITFILVGSFGALYAGWLHRMQTGLASKDNHPMHRSSGG